jgi:glutathione S-transferase
MKLHTFFQSGSAYRVRIALNRKRIAYEPIFVRGGQGSRALRSPAYLQENPQGVVPTLDHEGRFFAPSRPMMEYLEEMFPTPPILRIAAIDGSECVHWHSLPRATSTPWLPRGSLAKWNANLP